MSSRPFDEPAAPAPKLRRREALVGGVLLATAGLAFARRPMVPESLLGSAKLDDLVPKRMGRWTYHGTSGLVLPPPDQLRDRIYSSLLTQQYNRDDGAAVMLLIAYSARQDGTIQVHRPEFCYPASGLDILSNAAHPLALPGATVPARYLVTEGVARNEQLIYWTRIGSHFPMHWLESHLSVIDENLHRIIPDGVLVRVSTNVVGDARPLLDEFARTMVAAGGPRLRQVLLGRG